MKLYERLVEVRLRQVIEIRSTQCGFQRESPQQSQSSQTKIAAEQSFGKEAIFT